MPSVHNLKSKIDHAVNIKRRRPALHVEKWAGEPVAKLNYGGVCRNFLRYLKIEFCMFADTRKQQLTDVIAVVHGFFGSDYDPQTRFRIDINRAGLYTGAFRAKLFIFSNFFPD